MCGASLSIILGWFSNISLCVFRGLQVRVGAMEEEAVRCDEVLAEG